MLALVVPDYDCCDCCDFEWQAELNLRRTSPTVPRMLCRCFMISCVCSSFIRIKYFNGEVYFAHHTLRPLGSKVSSIARGESCFDRALAQHPTFDLGSHSEAQVGGQLGRGHRYLVGRPLLLGACGWDSF